MEEVAQSPAAPAKKATRSKRKKIAVGFFGLLLIAAVFAGIWFFLLRDTGPIPQKTRKSVSFALYYPSSLPAGYTLNKSSISVANSIVFYGLQSGSQTVTISQQAAPKIPPDLSVIQKFNTSFKNVNSPAGQAILGIDLTTKDPSAIIVTNTTLISLLGSKNVPTDTMTKLVQNMASLPQ